MDDRIGSKGTRETPVKRKGPPAENIPGNPNRELPGRHLDTNRPGAGGSFQEGRCRMGRKYIDCRDYPGDVKCTVAISADTEEELLEAVVEHGKQVHGYEDTAEFRDTVRDGMKEGSPRT